MLCNFIECRDGAAVAFNRDDMRSTFGDKRARQTAGAGPNFKNGDAVEWSGGARDATGQIEVEQEILTERFFGRKIMAPDDLAQRRKAGFAHFAAARAGCSCAESLAARLIAAIRLDGSARPVPAISNAVP